jgi:IclR family pca regulon transcriptional regulator
VAGRGSGPDFVEALARGLDILGCFDSLHPCRSLTEISEAVDLPRPTTRRLLLTLIELGFIRTDDRTFTVTPKVLELGMAHISSLGLWQIAQPHLLALVRATGEASAISELEGSDIVCIARIAVPRLIELRVDIGTRFPAIRTAQGKVLLAGLDGEALAETLAIPSRANLEKVSHRELHDVDSELAMVREQGWALVDEELVRGVRSIAAPLVDNRGSVRAAMNITVNSAEISAESLVEEYLPMLLKAAADITGEWALWKARPYLELVHEPSARLAMVKAQ